MIVPHDSDIDFDGLIVLGPTSKNYEVVLFSVYPFCPDSLCDPILSTCITDDFVFTCGQKGCVKVIKKDALAQIGTHDDRSHVFARECAEHLWNKHKYVSVAHR